MRFVIFGGLLVLAGCGSGTSGEIGKACVASDRRAANPRLCGCIQQVANQTLNRSDQTLAATFFADSENAHAIMINDSPAADAFWVRYRKFTDTAERSCR